MSSNVLGSWSKLFDARLFFLYPPPLFFCVNVSAATLPIWPSPPFDVCLIAWPMKKNTHQHRHQPHPPPLPWSCVFALLCLVSVSGEKSEGSGPPAPLEPPQGRPEAPRPKRGCSPEGPLGSLSAPLIACSSLGDMCSDM